MRACTIHPVALTQSSDWLAEQRTQWERRLDQLNALLIELHHESRKAE